MPTNTASKKQQAPAARAATPRSVLNPGRQALPSTVAEPKAAVAAGSNSTAVASAQSALINRAENELLRQKLRQMMTGLPWRLYLSLRKLSLSY